MSHEIWSPRFIDVRSGLPFLTLWDEQWDANVSWDGQGRFGFWLRNYARPGTMAVAVDLLGDSFRIVTPPGHPKPLDEISVTIRETFRWLEKEAEKQSPPRPLAPQRRIGWFILLAGAMLAALVAILARFA